ncbi:MAG TPA: peptidoglycan-associated lipoprotein Pal [Steroidobacteraceae bacterium]|nr:peptidoglycan-associated lipoprotein Pal [Steroidobacteraceae bacterium]
MKKIVSIVCLFGAAALLAGCPKKATTVEPPAAGTQVPGAGGANGAGGASTTTSPLGGEAGAMGGAGGPGPSEQVSRVIYFDFDKSDIKPEFAAVITANAQYLTAHPNARLKLEGNTDERGTREYNIGLGERRAQAVKRALMLQGAAESQLTTVSFGAERPAVEGDDEAAWSKNRRVDLVYTQ